MDNEVMKFDMEGDICGPTIQPVADGQYVLFEDYAALRDRVRTLEAGIEQEAVYCDELAAAARLDEDYDFAATLVHNAFRLRALLEEK